jgi:pyruvate/2-oxoglutarate dehydrogenase complex dihydrolipoamide acyltransferase (E2) component
MTASVPLILERDNVNDESVTLIRWFVRHGERVETGALLAEIETSKANVEVYAPAAGYLSQRYSEGVEVPVMSPIGDILEEAPEVAVVASTSSATPAHAVAAADKKETPIVGLTNAASDTSNPVSTRVLRFRTLTQYKQRFSPVASRMMEMHGLTAADFEGLSVVRKQDVLDRLSPQSATLEPSASVSAELTCCPITQPYQVVSLSKMKRREAMTLAGGTRNALPSAVSVACLTRGLRRVVETRTAGGNASAVIVYEVSRLLRKYPSLNATCRTNQMLQYEQVNVGYAMDDGRGLKVPVLYECDTRSLPEITAHLRDLTVAYLSDKLTPAQIANATFTISDLSGVGVTDFLPLISENQGAILGVGAEQFVPDGSYGAYTLTLTFDHQLTNGRTAALFLSDLKERLRGYEDTGQEASATIACSRCGRTGAELTSSNHYLLRSAVPEGYLCTLCASGY